MNLRLFQQTMQNCFFYCLQACVKKSVQRRSSTQCMLVYTPPTQCMLGYTSHHPVHTGIHIPSPWDRPPSPSPWQNLCCPSFGLLVMSILGFKARADPGLHSSLRTCNGFLRFSFVVPQLTSWRLTLQRNLCDLHTCIYMCKN